ncbi:hypothetical protein B9T24_12865 [Acinetobacter sp. ANC 4654]|nr:hypothetical protein B9T24_12865 [Acinetobacter sp. ANC 4654]
MNIHQIARNIAQTLTASECSQPFGAQCDVYKILGKVYLMAFELNGIPILNVKVDPQHGDMLRDFYPFIHTGYHMNKQHWISIYTHEAITKELLEDLIQSSYELVTSKLTKLQKQHLATLKSMP